MVDAVKSAVLPTEAKVDETNQPGDASAGAADKKPGGKPAKKNDLDFMAPMGLGPDGQARFARLVERTRSAEGALQGMRNDYEAVKRDLDDINSMFKESGATKESLNVFLDYTSKASSGDLEGARAVLVRELKAIDLHLGRSEGQEINPLEDYPDLSEAVDGMSMTREHAMEMARLRQREDGMRRSQDEARSRQEAEAAAKAEEEAAQKDILAWANGMRESDIDFVAAHKKLLPLIDDIVGSKEFTPKQWLPQLKLAYKVLKSNPSLDPSPGSSGPRPLRPSGGARLSEAPASLFDAVKSGVRQSRGL
jgi:hypothetical protein